MTILQNASVEITGRDVASLERAQHQLPAGTRVNVTYLGSEGQEDRLRACVAIRAMGFVPVPHLAARRFTSEDELRGYLQSLREAGCLDEVFLVGGDPTTPLGPYSEALDVLKTGLLTSYGARRVSLAGYPEGHPDVTAPVLDAALGAKCDELAATGLGGSIITQFGFDVDPVLHWIEEIRDRGIKLPVRVGVPGPAGVRRLLSFAKRFGVSSSAGIAKKYGFSLTNLIGTTGPDRFVSELAHRHDPGRHGEVSLHFYTFGGVEATADWLARAGRRPEDAA